MRSSDKEKNICESKVSVNIYKFLPATERQSCPFYPKRNFKFISSDRPFLTPNPPSTHLGSAKSSRALERHVFLVQSFSTFLRRFLLLQNFLFLFFFAYFYHSSRFDFAFALFLFGSFLRFYYTICLSSKQFTLNDDPHSRFHIRAPSSTWNRTLNFKSDFFLFCFALFSSTCDLSCWGFLAASSDPLEWPHQRSKGDH